MSNTVIQTIEQMATQLETTGVCFGHGSNNAYDEAAELVLFAAGIAHEQAPACYDWVLTVSQQQAIAAIVKRRITERIPAAYLTRRMWFAGHEFYVDERVLVPRSPIAELIEQRFQPWMGAHPVRAVLDIGTGSGCIAIACAQVFTEAYVDAVDVSAAALAVARLNIERHCLQQRVRAIESDVFSALSGQYDLIVSNPPYVSEAEMQTLPREYRHEPALGLRAGHDGLDITRRILATAHQYLQPHGVLIVEVGDAEHALVAAYPQLPFIWLEFERGGGGVFVLTAAQLTACCG